MLEVKAISDKHVFLSFCEQTDTASEEKSFIICNRDSTSFKNLRVIFWPYLPTFSQNKDILDKNCTLF